MEELSTEPAPIDESSTLGPRPQVEAIEVDDRVLLVDAPAGRVHALNATASLVWWFLDGATPVASIIDDLQGVFDVPRGVIADDVTVLLQNLATMGYLEGTSPDAAAPPDDLDVPAPDGCLPDPIPAAGPPTFDDRYLAAPPNT